MPQRSPFSKLWTSAGLSNLADGVLKTAVPLIAVRYTQSPGLIAGLAVAATLPWLLFALPAGAWADRLDRRLAMVGANAVRAAIAAGLAVVLATGIGSIWMLYAAAFLVGCCETLYDTAAQSILPQMVGRDALPAANARLQVVELAANMFVGPPLGGLLVALSAALAIGGTAGVWLAALAVLLLAPGTYRAQGERAATTIRADIAEGLRFLVRHRLLRTLAAMVALMNLASNVMFPVFVLFAVGSTSALGLSESQYGLLLSVLAVGSLAGAVSAARVVAALGRGRALFAAALVAGLPFGAPALTDNVWILAAVFALEGFAIAVWNVVTVSFRQSVTPDALLGRVNSGYRLVAWGSQPVGALTGGLLAEWLGLRPTFLIAGALALLTLVGCLAVTGPAMDAAERAVAAQPS